MAQLINLAYQDVDDQYSLDGYEAIDNGGDKMGKIDSVIAQSDSLQPRYLVVDSGGWFSSKKYVVPIGEVASVDDENKHVIFRTLTKDRLKQANYPEYNDEWWDSTNAQGGEQFSRYEQDVARTYEPKRRAGAAIDYQHDRLYQAPAEGAQRLRLLEEHLVANKDRYKAGSVRVGKRVVERQESIDVPVTEERVVIERTAATGSVTGKDAEFRDGQTIEVPVMRERATIAKEAQAVEDVTVRKEATQRTERVQDTVRREEAVIEDGKGLVAERSDRMSKEGDASRSSTVARDAQGRPLTNRDADAMREGPAPVDDVPAVRKAAGPGRNP